MARTYDFDIAVIGGGPGGYVPAIRASQLGARTALIEKGELGGVCGNVGCIPTKVLAHLARVILELERAESIGLTGKGYKLDFPRAARHRDGVVKRLRRGVETLLEANNVELVRGEASFQDDRTLSVHSGEGSRELSAERIIIATGSVPKELPDLPFDDEQIIDSSAAVNLNELPESLLIVGAGYIGCEFASAFVSFGVEVTVVEALEEILALMDRDCAGEVYKQLKKRGAAIHTGTTVEEVHRQDGALVARLGNGEEVTAEKVLVCVGRRPFTGGLELHRAGLKTNQEGAIEVNAHMQSAVPHIYAVGDVTGGMLLAHVASREGLVAAAHATGTLSAQMDYRVVPHCVFTFPEIAAVGLTEAEASEQTDEITVARFPMQALGKAHVDGATEGFVKLVADASTGQILGVHICSAEASTLIGEAALGLQLEVDAEELAGTIHPHPTLPESLREAAEGITGLPINWTG